MVKKIKKSRSYSYNDRTIKPNVKGKGIPTPEDNEEILDAVKYHTIGSENMSTLSKIIYLADAIEAGRTWDGVEKARELAKKDLDKALIYEIKTKLEYLLSIENIIHPNIILFRNSLIYKG